jgi:hypothetical protein
MDATAAAQGSFSGGCVAAATQDVAARLGHGNGAKVATPKFLGPMGLWIAVCSSLWRDGGGGGRLLLPAR